MRIGGRRRDLGAVTSPLYTARARRRCQLSSPASPAELLSMSTLAVQTPPKTTARQVPQATTGSPRLWPAVLLVAIFWAAHLVVARLEMRYFSRFLYSMAAPAGL